MDKSQMKGIITPEELEKISVMDRKTFIQSIEMYLKAFGDIATVVVVHADGRQEEANDETRLPGGAWLQAFEDFITTVGQAYLAKRGAAFLSMCNQQIDWGRPQ